VSQQVFLISFLTDAPLVTCDITARKRSWPYETSIPLGKGENKLMNEYTKPNIG
jgi:hypothetical protein